MTTQATDRAWVILWYSPRWKWGGRGTCKHTKEEARRLCLKYNAQTYGEVIHKAVPADD